MWHRLISGIERDRARGFPDLAAQGGTSAIHAFNGTGAMWCSVACRGQSAHGTMSCPRPGKIGAVHSERDAHEHDEDARGSRTRDQLEQGRYDLPCERIRARDAALDVTDDECVVMT